MCVCACACVCMCFCVCVCDDLFFDVLRYACLGGSARSGDRLRIELAIGINALLEGRKTSKYFYVD